MYPSIGGISVYPIEWNDRYARMQCYIFRGTNDGNDSIYKCTVYRVRLLCLVALMVLHGNTGDRNWLNCPLILITYPVQECASLAVKRVGN